MKIKKLLSLVLCAAVLMTTAAFTTGCEKDEDEDTGTKIDLVTLNMYIVTEDETDIKAAEEVEKAINRVTIRDFKAKLNINYIYESEFRETVDKQIEDTVIYKEELAAKKKAEKRKAAQEAATTKASSKKKKEKVKALSLDEEYSLLAKQGVVIPEGEYQIDIIVFPDGNMYKDYVDEKLLEPLDEYLKTDSKKLKSYIYPSYLEAAKLGGKNTYGIPVNGPIGTYEYIVIDGDIAKEFIVEGIKTAEELELEEDSEEYKTYVYNYVDEYTKSKIVDFKDLEPLLAAVKSSNNGYIPLSRATSPGNVEFYPEEGSPFGVIFEGPEWSKSGFVSLYHNEEFKAHYETIYNFRQAGYLAENDDERNKYAVQIITGSSMAEQAWEDQDNKNYVFIPYKNPKFDTNEALAGVFSISKESLNKARSMQIIEAFNTSSELANLLQWGVEGENYTLQSERNGMVDMGTITIDNDKGYKMNNNFTGNKYIKYRLEGTPNEFEGYKQQNTASWVGAFSGYYPEYLLTADDQKVLDELMDEYKERKAAAKENKEEFTEEEPVVISSLQGKFDSAVEITRKYYPALVSGNIEGDFNTFYDTILADLEVVAEGTYMDFEKYTSYTLTEPYTTFVDTMIKGSYPNGRIAGIVESEEEIPEEEAENATEESKEEATTEEKSEESENSEEAAE